MMTPPEKQEFVAQVLKDLLNRIECDSVEVRTFLLETTEGGGMRLEIHTTQTRI